MEFSKTCLFFLLFLPFSNTDRIELNLISNLYLPDHYKDGSAMYEYDAGTLEHFAVDVREKLIYTIGDSLLYIIDFSDVKNMTIIHKHEKFADGEMTDIVICGDLVLITHGTTEMITHNNKTETVQVKGVVLVFEKFKKTSKNLTLKETIEVGYLPDAIRATGDCSVIVVACEAEPFVRDGRLFDPPGEVAIIRYNVSSDKFTKKLLNFNAFNSKATSLKAAGVRVSNPNAQLADDMEPEFVDFNSDASAAYISLQDNNAIAEVDLVKDEITNIYPLGYKDWSSLSMDPSDKDGGIHLDRWPVYGLRMPDAIRYIESKGIGYIVTADEGDTREYDEVNSTMGGFVDNMKGAELATSGKKLNFPGELTRALQDDSKLGRLAFSTVDGLNNAKDGFEQLYAFGGRGFSIVRADTMKVVYDSGSIMEEYIAREYPYLFNAVEDKAQHTLSETRDVRSRSKGPEPEAIETADVFDKHIVFVTCERPGLIGVYSYTDDILEIRLESMWHDIPDSTSTFEEMYNQRIISALDPEDLEYVPASVSPNGKPLLLVAGTASGTVGILEINNVEEKKDDQQPGVAGKATISTLVLSSMLLATFLVRKVL